MIHIRDIDHLVLRVADLERTLAFYCDVLGCAVEHAVTRSVRDSAALLDVTAGPAPGDPYPSWPVPPGGFADVTPDGFTILAESAVEATA